MGAPKFQVGQCVFFVDNYNDFYYSVFTGRVASILSYDDEHFTYIVSDGVEKHYGMEEKLLFETHKEAAEAAVMMVKETIRHLEALCDRLLKN